MTGGGGFIGSHLAEHLITRGDQVTVLDNRRPSHKIDGAVVLQGDVMDPELMEPLVRDHDATFHLASVVGFANVMRDPLSTVTTTLYGGAEVLHFSTKYKKRVLITSTSAVYGKTVNGGAPVKETDPCLFGPTTTKSWSYAYAKAADECLALAYHEEFETPAIIARVFNTVGQRQSADAGFVLPRFVSQALQNAPLTVHAPGTQTRTFAHVRDTARGLADLMECDRAVGQVVNIGGTETISMWDLALKVKQFTESPSQVALVEQPYGAGYDNVSDRKPCLDKAWDLFRYLPRYGLDEMIHDVVEDFELRKVAA